MRFGFVTCVQLGLACIEEIYETGGRLDLIMTLEDDQARHKSGRVYFDLFCELHSIPLIKIRNINEPRALEALRGASLDWLFVIGWSQIAHEPVLSAPKRGVLGMHPTLLPEGRGRAAIPWAILKGLSETGVSLFQLDQGVDTGPILAQERIPIGDREDATSLYDRIARAHRSLIKNTWEGLVANQIIPYPQDLDKGSVWPGRTPEDGRLDLTKEVEEVDLMVRAVTRPYPGAFIDLDNKRLRIWKAHPTLDPHDGLTLACSNGYLRVLEHAWEGTPAALN